MASIQRAFVDAAIGDVPDIPGAVFSYQNEEERAICSSQKIVSTLHVSFSVLGLAILGFFGLFIIILSLTIESLSNFILKRFKTHAYSRLEWYSTGTLQLQRLAHEELGIGTWSACDSLIPIMHQDTILGVLDIKDTSHPVLRAATQADEVELLKRSQTNSDVSRNTETSVRDAEENNEQIGPDIANDSAPDGEGRAEGHETTSTD
ncbi:hypothetical protein GQ53DRAFT_819611 [Thozetella sp. PMI_491]|nr:hypothetical protein GQ53DRAFT_819611 [Thozetella sp. PMI_491]